jgi:TetR/AcrR family transcriptional regulator, transcriptional repressor for nem operon
LDSVNKETDAAFFEISFLSEDISMRKGELTRQRIIATAAPIFNQRGFAGCSMQDLMEVTGLEKGGLYRHFASKEELAAEAFKFALGQAVKTRTGDLAHIEGAVAKLRYIVERFVETPSPLRGGCPLMNTAIDADDGNPVLRDLAYKGIRDWKARLEKIVAAGIKNGEIRREVEPRRIANSMIAALEGALMISRLEGTRSALKDVRATLEEIVDGICATPAA